MTRLAMTLVSGLLLAVPAFAGNAPTTDSRDPAFQQAVNDYITTKLACNNMSQFEKEICMRDANEAYKRAKDASHS